MKVNIYSGQLNALEFSKSVKVVELEAGKERIKLVTQKVDGVTERI